VGIYENAAQYQRFRAMWQGSKDRRFTSAAYALSVLDRDLTKYVKAEHIDFKGLLAQAKRWSERELGLVRLAASLYSAVVYPASIEDVFYYLTDDTSLTAAMNALRLRYGVLQ
jgi:hypothetical protein